MLQRNSFVTYSKLYLNLKRIILRIEYLHSFNKYILGTYEGQSLRI